jgi:hypothetical protein
LGADNKDGVSGLSFRELRRLSDPVTVVLRCIRKSGKEGELCGRCGMSKVSPDFREGFLDNENERASLLAGAASLRGGFGDFGRDDLDEPSVDLEPSLWLRDDRSFFGREEDCTEAIVLLRVNLGGTSDMELFVLRGFRACATANGPANFGRIGAATLPMIKLARRVTGSTFSFNRSRLRASSPPNTICCTLL